MHHRERAPRHHLRPAWGNRADFVSRRKSGRDEAASVALRSSRGVAWARRAREAVSLLQRERREEAPLAWCTHTYTHSLKNTRCPLSTHERRKQTRVTFSSSTRDALFCRFRERRWNRAELEACVESRTTVAGRARAPETSHHLDENRQLAETTNARLFPLFSLTRVFFPQHAPTRASRRLFFSQFPPFPP